MTSKREGRLSELDGWRAVSVMPVILHHLASFQHRGILARHHHLVPMFRYFGPLGVRVFFVISGFVICRLLILEEDRYGTFSLKAFYIRRVFRIFPPLFLYLVGLILLLAFGLIVETYSGIANGAFFLYDLTPAKTGGWFIKAHLEPCRGGAVLSHVSGNPEVHS
jgi:peptidoglycan/LPS O-acetylase OafA/YrhL